MTHYQRISPIYEAVKYEPGMEDGFLPGTNEAYIEIHWARRSTLRHGDYILTNTATGERSVVSQKEFEREFRRAEG